MAYGRTCPICRGIVDNNEFNFAKNMCYECEEAQEKNEIRSLELERLMNSKFEQMVLEV